ncbi:MAG: hypothetical protein WKF71_10890 [Pyrinomonadaceae bacterium]
MSLTVVGSVAFDALETPFGKRDKLLGGAGTHFALSASFFTEVRVIGVVGNDFTDKEWAGLSSVITLTPMTSKLSRTAKLFSGAGVTITI